MKRLVAALVTSMALAPQPSYGPAYAQINANAGSVLSLMPKTGMCIRPFAGAGRPGFFSNGKCVYAPIAPESLPLSVTSTAGSVKDASAWFHDYHSGADAGGSPAFEQSGGFDLTDAPLVNLMSFIPRSLHAAIIAKTSVTDVTSYVQAAVKSANGACISLYSPIGKYIIKGNVLLGTCIKIFGAGKNYTIFQKTGSAGQGIFFYPGGETASRIDFASLTLDVNNVDTGLNIADVARFNMRDVRIINMNGWGAIIHGTNSEDTSSSPIITNGSVHVIDTDFDGSTDSREQLLLMNTRHTLIRSTTFRNGQPKSIGLGLYQNDYDVVCDACVFKNLNIGSYFSLSTSNIKYIHCSFLNNSSGIRGANLSDNGSFGAKVVPGITIYDSAFRGNASAAQFGASYYVSITDSRFSKNTENALVFDGGNFEPKTHSRYIRISNSVFSDNNQSATHDILHPAILFAGSGGEIDATLSDLDFFDDQSTPTQICPISFDGRAIWTNITFIGGSLKAYNGASSLCEADGAAISNVQLYRVNNLSRLPPGVTQH